MLDTSIDMQSWAELVADSPDNLLKLEVRVLKDLDWNLFVDSQDHLDVIAYATRLLSQL